MHVKEVICDSALSLGSSVPTLVILTSWMFLTGLHNYISSSIVIEIPVSSAWCVNVTQISFYSKKVLSECYLCIKHFGSYIWLFISVLLLRSLNWVESGLYKMPMATLNFIASGLRTFSRCVWLCYPKHRRRLMADCGMKVNVRIKKDILSSFNFSADLFYCTYGDL